MLFCWSFEGLKKKNQTFFFFKLCKIENNIQDFCDVVTQVSGQPWF